MNAKQFLQWGGIILVVVGILGFFLIGPTAEGSIFGEAWWFDSAENWAHLVIGIVALIAAYSKSGEAQRWVTWIVGIVALLVGVWGFVQPVLLGANLETLDHILHLVIGVWACWAAYKTPKMMVAPMAGGFSGPLM